MRIAHIYSWQNCNFISRYLRLGGFPAIHLREYAIDDAYAIVRDIYNSTIYTDIVKRNQIRKADQLERIVRFALDNIGRILIVGFETSAHLQVFFHKNARISPKYLLKTRHIVLLFY